MLHDTLADALCVIKNAERVGKKECMVSASKLIREVLKLLKDKGFISSFEFVNDGKNGKFRIELSQRIVDCNVIKPRFSVKLDELNKWEKRYLPSRDIGLLILTTSKGVVDNQRAREISASGKLLGYVY